MSYQVLARKWRPKKFSEMVGQQHVLKALINALEHNRLHHAYLFTGTRGVGKTTVARIFAKSLNCEKGVSAEPCGQCSACVEVDEGRFVDLIEVDAASRTKVEDTRELLENVQYAPTRGRYKVYLIDEVHMLSNHSFNALLKTLEEPPPHVKFLLATTDPQKLPVTILSRCLQFNLKNMTPEQIVGYLKEILQQENIPAEDAALWQLGRAADGSMRDALSLTDQAIAFGEGQIQSDQVSAMLGTMDRNQVFGLMEALTHKDASDLLAKIQHAAEFSPDFQAMMTELLSLLHRVAIAQIVPDAVDNSEGDRDRVLDIASSNSPEDIQLFYQIGLTARKDMPLAPDMKSGFEMALLRMLVFSPEPVAGSKPPLPSSSSSSSSEPAPEDPEPAATPNVAEAEPVPAQELTVDPVLETEPPTAEIAPVIEPVTERLTPEPEPEPMLEPPVVELSQPAATEPSLEAARAELEQLSSMLNGSPSPDPEPILEPVPESEPAVEQAEKPQPMESLPAIPDAGNWPQLFWQLGLGGIHESLFGHSQWLGLEQGQLNLRLNPDQEFIYQERHKDTLRDILQQRGVAVQTINIQFSNTDAETPFQYRARIQQEQRQQAIEMLKQDPLVTALVHEMDAVLDETTVHPVTN